MAGPTFRLLGVVEVDGRRIAAVKERALLAFLVLHANEFVGRDRLIDALWQAAPAGVQHALDVRVPRLRHWLGQDEPARAIETSSGGYELRADQEDIDVKRFERLVGEARSSVVAGLPMRSDDLLCEALALWRGPPMPTLVDYRFAALEAARLEDLRLTAIEDRADARLQLGRHAEIIGELAATLAEHPFRERARGQLMLALYRSGRQADALELYRDGRRLLVGELGIEPREGLKRFEEAILRHESPLDGPSDSETTLRALGSRPPPAAQ